jgi:hypothetical protein
LRRIKSILEKYSDLSVQYKIHELLKDVVKLEKDSKIVHEIQLLRSSIKEDLSFRTALSLKSDQLALSDALLEEQSDNHSPKTRRRWLEYVNTVAAEILNTQATAESVYQLITHVATQLGESGQSINLNRLFNAFMKSRPQIAIGIAKLIVAGSSNNMMLRDWPALIDSHLASTPEVVKLFNQAATTGSEWARIAMIYHVMRKLKESTKLNKRWQNLLFKIAELPSEAEKTSLFQLIGESGEENLSWIFKLFERLLEKTLENSEILFCLLALLPNQPRRTAPPIRLIQLAFKQMVTAPNLPYNSDIWRELRNRYPLDMYQFIESRIEYSTRSQQSTFGPIPSCYKNRLRFPELVLLPEAKTIVKKLWKQVSHKELPNLWSWVSLFQSVVFEDESFWHDELVKRVLNAADTRTLLQLIQLISFDGSMIIFDHPILTEFFLKKGVELGDLDLAKTVLYFASHSGMPTYIKGKIDPRYDHVRAAAVKAAEKHATHPILGEFYRWIIQVEEDEQLKHRLQIDMIPYGIHV